MPPTFRRTERFAASERPKASSLSNDISIRLRSQWDLHRMNFVGATFFNKVKQEQDSRRAVQDERLGPLEKLLEDAKTQPLEKIKTRRVFVVPSLPARKLKPSGKEMQRIRFERPLPKAETVKKALKAKSWQEVGERVFDYYYNAECEDE